jgi:hypothetical protein
LFAAVQDENWLKATSADTTWRVVLVELAERLSKASKDETVNWPDVHKAFRRLTNAGVPIIEAHLGPIAYSAGDFEEAIRLWEHCGTIDSAEYQRAKARIARFPENVVWFGRLKEYGEVVREWREKHTGQRPIDQLDDSVVWTVADAALTEGDLSIAATILESKPDRDRVGKLLAAAVKRREMGVATTAAVIAARLSVRSCAWNAAIRIAEQTDYSELPGVRAGELRAILAKTDGLTRVFQAVIQELAVSDGLTKEQPEPVREFLHRHFLGKATPQAGQHGVRPEVAGAAIERAGRIVDALQFYETLERDAPSDDLKKFAAERLVRNLERHAEYFEKRDVAEAQQRQSRAKAVRERAGLGDRKIAEYPVIRTPTASVGPTEWVRGPYRLVLSRPHARLRIEHRERFETVTVDGKERSLLGDAAFSKLDSTDGRPQWRVAEWDTIITLVDRDRATVVVVQAGGELFEIELA